MLASSLQFSTALPPYRSPEQLPGPCYVLDPKAWPLREVLAVLPPKLPALKRPKLVLYRGAALAGETRRVVAWPQGRPLEWRFEQVPTRRAEPVWHGKARALRARGYPIRRIMTELGLVNREALDRVLRPQ